ncbi:hypothetical protein GCM10028798_30740 [Humibacter antri]
MVLIDDRRDERIDRLRSVLSDAVAGSTVTVTGSIGRGTADQYSDIDLRWDVPVRWDELEPLLAGILEQVGPVAALRHDNEPGVGVRIVFLRFEDWPLFSRVDLEITGDFPFAPPGPWSAPESALMNVVGALKAHLRGRPSVADGLLSRGCRRIDIEDDSDADELSRMRTLAARAADLEPRLTPLHDLIARAIAEASAQ